MGIRKWLSVSNNKRLTNMQTTASLKRLTAACLVLLGGAAAVNAQLIFKADQTAGLSVSGNQVTSWSDSGANYTLTPSGTAPTFTPGSDPGAPNGQGFVSFNNSPLTQADAALSPLISASQSAAFVVLRTSAQNKTLLSWRKNGIADFSSLLQVSENSGRISFVQRGALSSSISAAAPTWNSDFHLLTLVRNGTSGQLRFDGTPLSSPLGAFSGSMDTVSQGLLALGGLPASAGDTWTGDIAELRVYSTVPADISAVENTMGGIYGLTAVPEPSQFAMIFGLACVAGALVLRHRRQTSVAR
jgi:hypothetical protein